LLTSFFPRSKLGDPAFFFTGTPYGPADIVPIEADVKTFSKYRFLIMLGWNTNDAGQLERLTQYVEEGGHLVLSLSHLSTEVRRGQPTSPIADPQVRKLLGLEIHGLTQSVGKWTARQKKDRSLAEAIRSVSLPLGDVELHESTARIRMKEESFVH